MAAPSGIQGRIGCTGLNHPRRQKTVVGLHQAIDIHKIAGLQRHGLTGSIGMLPSASLNTKNQGLYEPSHGSAPDIAGKGVANPLATILSAAMMLRFSLNQEAAAQRIEAAVQKVLAQGYRTADIYSEGTQRVSTKEMGDAVLKALA